jgi:peroxiredoxin
LVLYVPKVQERLFEITLSGRRLKINFINDSKLIRVRADYFSDQYTIEGSPATTSINNFEKEQLVLADKNHKVFAQFDSLKGKANTEALARRLTDTLDKQLAYFFNRYVQYADTVKSPAAFVRVYNVIDFDKNYKALKKFITFNAARFPNYAPIQEIKKRAMDVIRIYEEEFNLGDKLPSITLNDVNDLPFSTSSLKGQYYLIDFWSILCQDCIVFKTAEKRITDKGYNKVKFVSVALDDQKQNWKSLVLTNKLNWTQLIDEEMWDGPTVRTLVFDSIPFNFLVSPQGRVIKKAIKPDSLESIISHLK